MQRGQENGRCSEEIIRAKNSLHSAPAYMTGDRGDQFEAVKELLWLQGAESVELLTGCSEGLMSELLRLIERIMR